MPTTPPSPGFARASSADRAQRVRFRRAVTLMLMTLVAPGSAQVMAGNRKVGWTVLRVWGALALVVLGVVLASLAWPQVALWLGTRTMLLAALRWGLILLALVWAWLFVDAWRLGQPLSLRQNQRLAVVGLNGFLSLSVAGTLIFGAHLVGVQRNLMVTMFGDGAAVGAHHGRYNVLLMGGDSGAGRWGLRPDSLTVASIDAETGRTVLIGLPRNMANFPFREGSVMDRQFPDGFDCDGCYLNGVSTWAGDHTDLFGGSEHPGTDATVSAVEGITGLRINYWSMVNLRGFKDLVDAFGGVTLNVRDEIPVGLPSDSYFHYLDPGTRKLDGQETLWFARARYGSDDYSRMARQKCVMNAMLQQVSPQTALSNFESIARASSAMVSTNIPHGEVDTFAALALKARREKVATVSLVPPQVDTADPDIDQVHEMVTRGIERSENPPSERAAPRKPPRTGTPATTGGSLGTMKQGYVANQADDLGAAC